MSDLNQNERELPVENEKDIEEQEETKDAFHAKEASVNSPKKKTSWLKEAVDYMEIFVFAICFVMLLFSFVFRVCTVEGPSMENTLYEGENLIISDLFYTPERDDIIVFHQTGSGAFALNEPVVKRVIATEGETVSIKYRKDTMSVTVTHTDGSVTVLEEPYMRYEGKPLYSAPATYTVPEGHLFVLGDNRNESADSRYTLSIGMVDTRRVLGKVLFRITPFSRIGTVG